MGRFTVSLVPGTVKRLNKYLLNRMEKTPLEAVSRLYKAFSHWEPMVAPEWQRKLEQCRRLREQSKGSEDQGAGCAGPPK